MDKQIVVANVQRVHELEAREADLLKDVMRLRLERNQAVDLVGEYQGKLVDLHLHYAKALTDLDMVMAERDVLHGKKDDWFWKLRDLFIEHIGGTSRSTKAIQRDICQILLTTQREWTMPKNRGWMMRDLAQWTTQYQGQDDRLDAQAQKSLGDYLLSQGWVRPERRPLPETLATVTWADGADDAKS